MNRAGTSDTAMGLHIKKSGIRDVRSPLSCSIQSTAFEVGKSTPGSFLRRAWDIRDKIANGGALIHILVRLDPLGAPEPDGI